MRNDQRRPRSSRPAEEKESSHEHGADHPLGQELLRTDPRERAPREHRSPSQACEAKPPDGRDNPSDHARMEARAFAPGQRPLQNRHERLRLCPIDQPVCSSIAGQTGRRKGASTFSFAPHPPTASSALAIDRVEGSPAAS